MSLQQRRNEQTRAEIYGAATALFLKNGVKNVSVAEIANAADISRRTIYRHFRTKEEIVYEVPRRWLNHYKTTVATRKQSETDSELCHRSLIEVARFIQSDVAGAQTALRLVSAMPSFASAESSLNREWLEAHRSVLSNSIKSGDADEVLRASLMAGALVGGTDAVLYHWLQHPKVDLVALTERVWKSVDQIRV